MRLLKDLGIAFTVTVVVGLCVLQAWTLWSFSGRGIIAALGVISAVAAGPILLARRGHSPIIPIASVYCVVMFFVLLFLDFVVSWYRGSVDL